MVVQHPLLVVFFGLRLQHVCDGYDSIDVVSAYFEVTPFDVLVTLVGPALVVLKTSLVFFLAIVVCQMNASQDKVRVVFKIRIDI